MPTSEDSKEHSPNEYRGISRRNLLVGLGGTAAVALGLSLGIGTAAKNVVDSPDSEGEKPHTEPTKKIIQNREEAEITPEQKRQTWETLKLKLPELAKKPFLIFSIHDEDVYLFLEICSLQDFMELGIITGKESFFELFDTPKLWKRAVSMNRQRKPYRDAVLKAPDETLTLGRLLGETKLAMETLRRDILPLAELANGFGKYLDPELMVAIFMQEVGPCAGTGKNALTPKGCLELSRMMLQNGWQAQKTPALMDSSVSFGLGQMTEKTHNGLQRAYHDETDGFIEPDFTSHVSAQQQIRNALLLAFANLQSFSEIAEKYPDFLHAFHEASELRRGRFLAPIIAAYHNYGGRGDLKNRIVQALKKKRASLEEYRTAFLSSIASLKTASAHAQNSAALYSTLKMRAERLDMEDVAGDPVPDEEEIPPMETLPVTEDRLAVSMKQHPKNGERMAFYTFSIPQGVSLASLLKYALKEGKTPADVEDFQGGPNPAPAGNFHIPLSYLPPELRNRRFARIAAVDKKPMELLEVYVEGGLCNRNRALAILYGTTWQELRVPAGLVKQEIAIETPPSLAWVFPTDGGITQPFHGITSRYERTHHAWDIGSDRKPEVWAAADGVVVKIVKGCKPHGEKKQPSWCKSERNYGNYVDVAHGGDRFTRYAHLESVAVQKGQRLKAGEPIGKMGNTGSVRSKRPNGTGIHCHFEYWKDGKKQDPAIIFPDMKKLAAL